MSWIEHVKKVAKSKKISYKDALKVASKTYKKKATAKKVMKPKTKKPMKKRKVKSKMKKQEEDMEDMEEM